MSDERLAPDELLARLERSIDDLRRALLRYEREIDPDSAYVLSDYLDALRLDAREAAANGDDAALRSVLEDVRDLQRDTHSRLGPDPAGGPNEGAGDDRPPGDASGGQRPGDDPPER